MKSRVYSASLNNYRHMVNLVSSLRLPTPSNWSVLFWSQFQISFISQITHYTFSILAVQSFAETRGKKKRLDFWTSFVDLGKVWESVYVMFQCWEKTYSLSSRPKTAFISFSPKGLSLECRICGRNTNSRNKFRWKILWIACGVTPGIPYISIIHFESTKNLRDWWAHTSPPLPFIEKESGAKEMKWQAQGKRSYLYNSEGNPFWSPETLSIKWSHGFACTVIL